MQILSCCLWDLAPCSGIEPQSLELEVWSLSHWATRDIPPFFFFWMIFFLLEITACSTWAQAVMSAVQPCVQRTGFQSTKGEVFQCHCGCSLDNSVLFLLSGFSCLISFSRFFSLKCLHFPNIRTSDPILFWFLIVVQLQSALQNIFQK